MNAETKLTLADRVLQFQLMELPGQPMMMHMGTSYLVNDLWSVHKDMAEALQAEEEADRLFDAADEYTHRAEGEGWLNDPTGSMHVTEAWDRARQAREHAKELRRAALSKAGG